MLTFWESNTNPIIKVKPNICVQEALKKTLRDSQYDIKHNYKQIYLINFYLFSSISLPYKQLGEDKWEDL